MTFVARVFAYNLIFKAQTAASSFQFIKSCTRKTSFWSLMSFHSSNFPFHPPSPWDDTLIYKLKPRMHTKKIIYPFAYTERKAKVESKKIYGKISNPFKLHWWVCERQKQKSWTQNNVDQHVVKRNFMYFLV